MNAVDEPANGPVPGKGGPSQEEVAALLAQMKAQAGPQAASKAVQTYRERIAGWDRNHVANLLSAAVLDPRNAWRGMRLTIALHAAAALDETGIRPSAADLKSVLDKGGDGTVHHIEDPLEGPYVWQVRFRRSHRFICGPQPDDTFYLPGFWRGAQEIPGEAGVRIRDALLTAGTIAELAASRAGLPRVAGPGRTSSRQILFPAAAFKGDIGTWSEIREETVQTGLENPANTRELLNRLCTTWGALAASDPISSPLLTRPLVKTAQGWQLVSAQHLARAAMALALEVADAAGVLAEYRTHVRHALVDESVKWCERLGWSPVEHKIHSNDIDGLSIAIVPYWTSQRATVNVVVLAHVPSVEALKDPDEAPRLELPAMAGKTGLSTMLSMVKFPSSPDRQRQLMVLAAPASSWVLKGSDRLPDVSVMEILSLPQLIWTMLSHRGDPRFLLRFWQHRAALDNQGVHVLPDEFTALCAWSTKETLYLSDDAKPSMMQLTGDFVSAAWQELIEEVEPSFVERAGKSLQRFRLGPEPELTIFTREDGAFEIEHRGSLACVVTAPEENRELARMTSFWYWDLCRELPNPQPAGGAEMEIQVGGPFAIEKKGNKVIITVPAEVPPDGSVETHCAKATLEAIEFNFGTDARQKAKAFLDARLANSLYRHQRVTEDPTLMGFGQPNRHGPTVREAYRDSLMDVIGPACIEALELKAGVKGKEDSKKITAWVWPFVLEKLEGRLRSLDGPQAIEFCLTANESIIHRMQSAEFHQAYDETLWASLPNFHGEHVDQWTKVQRDALASRFVLECLVAIQPTGSEHVDDEVFEELLSLASSVVDWGYADEGIHFGVDDSKVHVLASQRVSVSAEARAAMSRRLASQQLRAGPRSHLAEAQGAPSIEPVTLEEAQALVDACLQLAHGFSSTDLLECARDWVKLCAENGGKVTKVSRTRLVEVTGKTGGVAANVLDALTLGKRTHLLPEGGQDHRGILPWVFNRKLSLLWRPIVKIENDYFIAMRGLMEAVEYQIHQLLQGRGPREGPCESLISLVIDKRGKALTDAVAGLYQDAIRYAAVKNFKGKNKLALPKELGDIDVLVFDLKRMRVEVIEAKNYFMAKTPREIASQHRELFVSEGGKLCMADRHKRRVKWVKSNLSELLVEFKQKPGAWTVRGFMVMGGFSVHAAPTGDVAVISFQELRDRKGA